MSHLEIVGVSKYYEATNAGLWALRDLSLGIERGEFVVLLGPSGCGKTTLLHILAGLASPTSGSVLLDGERVRRCGPERSLIFQSPRLFPWLTAEKNVSFGLRMAGHSAASCEQAAREALERMGLGEAASLYPHELSGGMQQRVALARALVLDPRVLLMDEPLASVDALMRSRLQSEIRTCCEGKTVVFVTHSIREALIMGDRLVILSPRPGRVSAEIRLKGTAPRPLSGALADLERDIASRLLCDPVE